MENHLNEAFMRMAINLAEVNVKQGGGPFGAVVVKNGVFVAGSANKVIAENDPTAHAEVSAIRLACRELGTFDLSGCDIYTSCEPCPMCLGAIYWARINKIYYANTKSDAAAIGFDDNYIYEELKAEMEHRNLRFVQLLRDEALQTFKQWESSTSKTNY
jgi:guanine deaminase